MKRRLLPALMLFFAMGIFTACEELTDALPAALTEAEVVEGLKAALSQGTNNGTTSAGKVDGYLKNELIKILLPDEVKQVQSFLDNPPSVVNDNVLFKSIFNTLTSEVKEVPEQLLIAMNRGAEKAAPEAKEIFLTAITNMTIEDAFNILKGEDKEAATNYLRKVTTDSIISKFAPIVNNSLKETKATDYYTTIVDKYNGFIPKYNGAVSTYNLLATNKLEEREEINPNLGEYATAKAADGLFKLIAEEEKKIREDPLARATEILRRVFKEQDN